MSALELGGTKLASVLGSGPWNRLAHGDQSNAPVVSSDGSVLYFSDTGNQSLAFSALHLDGGGVTAITNLGSLGGMALDPLTGDLIAANHSSRTVARIKLQFPYPKGSVVAVHGREGRPLKMPNGLAVRSDGLIYFTDSLGPWDRHGAVPRPWTPASDGPIDAPLPNVIYSTRKGSSGGGEDGGIATVEALYDWPGYPNGLGLAPDERTLYVARTLPLPSGLDAFDVDADGRLRRRRQLVASTLLKFADGLSVAPSGIVFVACGASVAAYEPSSGALAAREAPASLLDVAISSRSQLGSGETLFATGAGGVWALALGSGARARASSAHLQSAQAPTFFLALSIAVAAATVRRWRRSSSGEALEGVGAGPNANGMARRLRWRAARMV